MPLYEAVILYWHTNKSRKFSKWADPSSDLYVKLPLYQFLPHLAQFLHISAIPLHLYIISIEQFVSLQNYFKIDD